MKEGTDMEEAPVEEMPNIEVDPMRVLRVTERKLDEANRQNTLLMALVGQLQDQNRELSEMVEELAKTTENRAQRRTTPKPIKPTKKKARK